MDDPSVRLGDLAATANALFVVDRGSTIVTWNAGAETLLKRPAQAAIGRKCYEIIGGRLPSGKRLCCAGCCVRTRARRQPAVRDFEMVVQDGHGQRRVLMFSTTALPAAGNHCTVHIMRQATSRRDRRRASSRLAELERLHLTRREGDVLRVLAIGGSTTDIAKQLCVSPLTVRTHVRNLLRKHNLHSRAQLIILALRKDASS
jgi:DNA-binding CsgD family transcriptional regulator